MWTFHFVTEGKREGVSFHYANEISIMIMGPIGSARYYCYEKEDDTWSASSRRINGFVPNNFFFSFFFRLSCTNAIERNQRSWKCLSSLRQLKKKNHVINTILGTMIMRSKIYPFFFLSCFLSFLLIPQTKMRNICNNFAILSSI